MGGSAGVSRKARYWSLGAVGLGIVVVLIAAFACRRVILEEWHIFKLSSTDEETRAKVAKALAQYGSERSILPLMKANSDSLTSLLHKKGQPDALTGMEKNFARMLGRQERLTQRISATSPDKAQEPDDLYQWVLFDTRLADLATELATILAISPYSLSLRRVVEREKEAAVPYLVQALENDNWHIRWQAAQLLGTLGPDAEDAVPVLKAKLEDPNSFVRYAAGEALERIGHE